jgi:hypothetical protein
MSSNQFVLPFQQGLTAQYPRWRDVLAHAVYSSRHGLNGVAAHMDQSPSDLSKRLSSEHGDPRPMREEDILGIIETTGDLTIIYWLVEKFIQSPDAQRTQAIAQLAQLMPTIQALVESATATDSKRSRR